MSLPPDGKFRAGDRVRIGTWEGTLSPPNADGQFFIQNPMGVTYFDERGCSIELPSFGPLMQLIERPKRKVKRGVILFSHDGVQAWSYGDSVQSNAGSVIWQGEIEVEE